MDLHTYFRNLINRAKILGIWGVLLTVLGKLLEDRLLGGLNDTIDLVLSSIFSYIAINPFRFLWIIGLSFITATFLLAYRDTRKRPDLISYDDLKLAKDSDDAYLTEYTKLPSDAKKIWLVVQNGNKAISNCVVSLENLEYWNNEWVAVPGGFDRKALKWDVGYIPDEGKIGLSPGQNANLELAKGSRNPQMSIEISHLDGYSSREHNLEGRYKATLRIDATISADKRNITVKPIKYDVTFRYRYAPSLEIEEVKRL